MCEGAEGGRAAWGWCGGRCGGWPGGVSSDVAAEQAAAGRGSTPLHSASAGAAARSAIASAANRFGGRIYTLEFISGSP